VAGQVEFSAEFVEHRHRGLTFFRSILLIPLIIWAAIYAIGVYVVVFLAWFALLFTGRYPEGMYNFVAGFIRFSGRLGAYASLMTDTYAPFGGGDYPEYPVRVEVAPPLERYGRWRVFLRYPIYALILVVFYVGYAAFLPLLFLSGIPALHWITIVNDGRARPTLQRLTWVWVAFQLRLSAYLFLMAQDFPPFLGEWKRSAVPATPPAA
jgi:hypothetical protein